MRITIVLLASVAALSAGATAMFANEDPARATFPGTNGRIAFASTRGDFGGFNIYTMSFTGENVRRLTSGPVGGLSPAYSPDGRRIAFVGSAGRRTDIYVMDANGSNKRLVTDERKLPGESKADYDPAFSPDGRAIVFARGRGEFDYDLYKINIDGSSLKPVFRSPRRDEQPAWSPDGGRIAFRYGNQVATVKPNGTGLTVLRPGYDPDWSPDGARLAFAADDGSHTPDEIFVMNANGSGVEQLTDPERDPLGFSANGPAFSPGGGKIVFNDGRDGDQEIFMMRADGTGETNLTHNKEPVYEVDPAWQPVH